jgi:signal peptidase I
MVKNPWHTHVKRHSKKVWDFFWNEDSVASFFANVLVAFLVIYFILYPVLGMVLGTSFPIVAVVSESMEHSASAVCQEIDQVSGRCSKYSSTTKTICGNNIDNFLDSFDNYWDVCGYWYDERRIPKEQFDSFPMKNGFNKGDVIILFESTPQNTDVGDVLIFQANRAQPIIHRVVDKYEELGVTFYQTKGDHNSNTISSPLQENKIHENRVFGKAWIRLPYLGWIKILFADLVSLVGIKIVR